MNDAVAFIVVVGLLFMVVIIVCVKNGLFSSKPQQHSDVNYSASAIKGCADNAAYTMHHIITNLHSLNINKYIRANPVTISDAIIFMYVILTTSVNNAGLNPAKVFKFENKLNEKTISLIYQYMQGISAADLFHSRTAYYFKLIKNSSGDNLSSITGEFENIIKHDIVHKTFKPFSEESPLPLLGFNADFECHAEVSAFVRLYVSQLSSDIFQITEALK